jgi:hypothetical protein
MVAGAVAGAALGAVTGRQLNNAWTQVTTLLEQSPTPGPPESQYALVAVSGPYPSVRGGTVTLAPGDVWKYGISVDPSGRYPKRTLTGLNLTMVEQTRGTANQVLSRRREIIVIYSEHQGMRCKAPAASSAKTACGG